MLNHGFWERRFAGNPNVIGQNVLLNGQGFTIIGVAPKGFQGTAVIGGPDMWVPMSMHDQILYRLHQAAFFNERRFLGFSAVARLKDGARPEQAKRRVARRLPLIWRRLFRWRTRAAASPCSRCWSQASAPNQRGPI